MKTYSLRLPFSNRKLRFGIDNPFDSALHGGGLTWGTNLTAELFHRGKSQGVVDYGSGLVTNIGAMAIANEAITLASPSGARINTLFLANQHVSGTGGTTAAVLDYKMQTISANGGQTAVAGTQSFSSAGTMAVPVYKTVATISYTGTETVAEWGLMTNATLSATTGSPMIATTTATTFTGTSNPFTASSSTVQGLQQTIVEPGTTTVLGLIQSNTTGTATLVNNGTTGWFTKAAMTAGSTPGNTETYTLRPILWDRKIVSILVGNGDSIQFSYSLTITSGG